MKELYEIAFVAALVAPLVALTGLALRCRVRGRRGGWPLAAWVALLLVSLAAHPLLQFWTLEGVDTRRGSALARRASDAGLVGMSTDETRLLIGDPDRVSRDARGGERWQYKQLPGYWLGSRFEVFFDDGVVTYFEANDD